MQMRGKARKQEARKGITGLLPVIQVEVCVFFFFFSKKSGVMGMENKQWTGETLRRRSKQDLPPQEEGATGKEESKKSFYFLKR